MVWIHFIDEKKEHFEVYQVYLGKFGYNFSFGFGNINIPFCKGAQDLCDQKIGRLKSNIVIDFTNKNSKNDDDLIAWYSGSGMDISSNDVVKKLDHIIVKSNPYLGTIRQIPDFIRLFNSEKNKWHNGLTFYCVVNNIILEYVFSLGANLEMESRLNDIYKNEKWKARALKSIFFIKSAQQGVPEGANFP